MTCVLSIDIKMHIIDCVKAGDLIAVWSIRNKSAFDFDTMMI